MLGKLFPAIAANAITTNTAIAIKVTKSDDFTSFITDI
jgi:hypothetical protein